jgi:hypothetical protein
MKGQLLPEAGMRAGLRKDDLKLLLLEENANESVNAGGGVGRQRVIHLHFTVFLKVKHPSQTLQTTP